MQPFRTLLKHRQCTRPFFTIIDENCRGVKLNFGKYREPLEPGVRLNLPLYHDITIVSLTDRVQYLDRQSIISNIGVNYKNVLNNVCYIQIWNCKSPIPHIKINTNYDK